jgi:tRNA (mo5U34)-methyltransferase
MSDNSIMSKYSREEILNKVQSVKYWRHSIALGQGIITPGVHSYEQMKRRLNRNNIPDNLNNKTVIDVGAWDGFFSFECERRGAKCVAADHNVWHEIGMDGFLCAKDVLDSKVKAIDILVEDLSRESVGQYDICLFFDVLYHLKDPMLCLKRISEITKELLILETLVHYGNKKIPTMRYLEKEFSAKANNWWAPNVLCLLYMLQASGFQRIEIVAHPGWKQQPTKTLIRRLLGQDIYGRCTVHAWKA